MSIQTQIERLTGAKATLKTAIEQKGVAVPEGAPLEQYATLVEQITQGHNWQRIEKSAEDTTFDLQPNTLYIWPEMTSLTVTFAAPTDTNIANEYHFFFASGSVPTTLSMAGVTSDAYSIEANHKYEVSVLEGVAYVKGVPTA